MKKSKIEKYQRAADMGENAASNFVNFGVKKKSEGSYKLKRTLLLMAYILVPVAIATVFISIKILPILATLPVFTWMFIFFTWRYASIEYEYIILDGEFRMLEVYGAKSMRVLCSTRVSGMTAIAPYNHANKAAADAVPAANRIEAVSSMSASDIYYAVFKDGGEDFVVFFEATEKTLKALRYYNDKTVITKTRY